MKAIETLIIKQEKQLFLRKESVSVLSALIDDEFVEIGSSAKLYDKAEVIRWLKSEEKREIHGINFKTTFLSDEIVLLTYISVTTAVEFEQPKQAFRSSIWRHSAGNWRMIFHQGTPIN